MKNSNHWVVPVEAGTGQIFKIGKQPINASAQDFYNVVSPNQGGDWTLHIAPSSSVLVSEIISRIFCLR